MSQPAAPLHLNPLQRLWLRELGIERLWLQSEQTTASAVKLSPDVSAIAPEVPAPERAPVVQTVVPVVRPDKVIERSAGVVAPVNVPPVLADDALNQTTLASLREQVLSCTACGLCHGRRNAVFGQGAQPARWLVIGEAPGEQEDRQGQPFVGRSGQLLDAMLAAVNKSRQQDVFIANVIKCRPPGNRNPQPEEIAACSPFLMRQIALLKPERILVLGRFAAQTLLATEASIASLRGRVYHLKTEYGGDIPVVVSYHPAYLLRSPSEKARAWQDLMLAARA